MKGVYLDFRAALAPYMHRTQKNGRARFKPIFLRYFNRKSVCGRHFQQTGHQPGIVANPARGQLNKETRIFPVPVRTLKFGLAS